MGFNYLFSNRFRNYFFVSLVLSVAMLYGVFAMPLVTYNSPTVANYTTVTNNWTYINITSDENLSSAFIEWGNSSGFTNVSMANTSLVNWYNNTTSLIDGVYNYTIWAQNTTGNWSQSDRRFVVIDTIMPYNLSTCQDLTVENGSYVLVSNVSSNSTCFNIMANNITLDGAGYTVEYAKTTLGYGVNNSGGFDNVTVKNLDVLQCVSGISYSYAIYANGMQYSNITNNTINVDSNGYGYGMYINNSNENIISNNTFDTHDAGIYLLLSNRTIVFNNIIKTTGMSGYGIYMNHSNLNNISNNNINSGSTGIHSFFSNSNTVYYNSIQSSFVAGYGMHFELSNMSMITNNTINNNFDGIYIRSSKTNTFSNNTISTNMVGIRVRESTNMSINENTISAPNSYAVYVEPSTKLSDYNHTINETNVATGKYIYYYFNDSSIELKDCSDISQIYVINSTNVTLKNITMVDDYGIRFAFTINSSIINSNISIKNKSNVYAIYEYASNMTNITNNTIMTSGDDSYGMYLDLSNMNNISNNTITTTGNSAHGVYADQSNSNIFLNNTINGTAVNIYGVYIKLSDNITIENNTITTSGGSSSGLGIYFSDSNNIINNIIKIIGFGMNAIDLSYSKNLFISGNKMNTSMYAIFMDYNSDVSYYNHTIDTSNTEQGSPIYYYYGNDSIIIENLTDVGQLIVANSTNITVRNITSTKDGIIFANTINSSILNSNITTTGRDVPGIYFYDLTESNNVSNNTITTFGVASRGIYLSGNANKISNNTIMTFGTYGIGITIFSNLNQILENIIKTFNESSYGISLSYADINIITNNVINTSSNSSTGMSLYLSDMNIFTDNNIFVSGQYDAYGMYLKNSAENSIFGGSIFSDNNYDYFLYALGNSNTFRNTNFTDSRTIYFNDDSSWFNYNDESFGDLWVNTGVSASANITRAIINWNNSLVKWNDTNSTSGVTATYNISGLSVSSQYTIYNKTALSIDNRLLTTDSNGKLPSFSIFMNGETQIIVEYVVPTPPDSDGDDSSDDDILIVGSDDDLNETEDDNIVGDVSDPVVADNSTPVVVEDSEIKIKARDKLDELNELLGNIDDELILAKIKEAEEALALGQYSKAYALALQAENMIAELQDGSTNGKSNMLMIVMIFIVLIGFTVVVAYFVYKKDGGIGIADLETPSDTDSDGFTVPSDDTIGGVLVPIGNESASADESFNSYDNSQTQNFEMPQNSENQLSDLPEGVSNSEELISPDNSDAVSNYKRVESNQTDEVEEELDDEFQDALKKLRHENKDNS